MGAKLDKGLYNSDFSLVLFEIKLYLLSALFTRTKITLIIKAIFTIDNKTPSNLFTRLSSMASVNFSMSLAIRITTINIIRNVKANESIE